MIPTVIRKLLRKEEPALTGCEQQWDYLYAKDCPLFGHYCFSDTNPQKPFYYIMPDSEKKKLTWALGYRNYIKMK